MNILIPMAGVGKRFKDVGYELPKPLIDVRGKPMISRVLDGLQLNGNYIFIVQKNHVTNYHLDITLKELIPDCTIVELDGITEGQAISALSAKSFIDSEDELLIVNCDNYFLWDSVQFKNTINNSSVDGMIFTFIDDSGNDSWSYARVDADGIVLEVAEKKVISNVALAGAFYWKRGKDFVNYANRMIDKNVQVNNEFYISPVFNEAISDGKLIRCYDLLEMRSMDDPTYLNNFTEWLDIKTSFRSSTMKDQRKLKTAFDELRNGKPIVLVDEYDRENEGDLVIAAEKANIENLVFTMNYARGLMCMPVLGELLDRLEIPPMVENNTDKQETPFSVSVDAAPHHGVTTGMSVHDKLKTIQVILDNDSAPEDLTRPGHLFPLRARKSLLKERRGHTEGSIQLMKLAGLRPAAIICEIMNTDGTMTKGGDLNKFAVDHGLTILSIEELYEATYNESL